MALRRTSGDQPTHTGDSDGPIDVLVDNAFFSIGVAMTGDIGRDVTAELAVGAFLEDRGHADAGAV